MKITEHTGLITAVIFLAVCISCTSSQKGILKKNEEYDYEKGGLTSDSTTQSKPQTLDLGETWQEETTKEEREWFIAVLIIVGIALATSASISAAFRGEGLSIGVGE